jgi:putative addiction module CopG family antidote
MVTMTADVTEGVRKMAKELIKTGLYKSQSEVVRDAIRQLAYRYKIGTALPIEKARSILDKAAKKSGKSLSETLKEIRDEE